MIESDCDCEIPVGLNTSHIIITIFVPSFHLISPKNINFDFQTSQFEDTSPQVFHPQPVVLPLPSSSDIDSIPFDESPNRKRPRFRPSSRAYGFDSSPSYSNYDGGYGGMNGVQHGGYHRNSQQPGQESLILARSTGNNDKIRI